MVGWGVVPSGWRPADVHMSQPPDHTLATEQHCSLPCATPTVTASSGPTNAPLPHPPNAETDKSPISAWSMRKGRPRRWDGGGLPGEVLSRPKRAHLFEHVLKIHLHTINMKTLWRWHAWVTVDLKLMQLHNLSEFSLGVFPVTKALVATEIQLSQLVPPKQHRSTRRTNKTTNNPQL